MSKTQRPSSARKRILETAEKLFYAEGIRAVGIDRVI
ncbi:MAG: TetR/AcrR family transcriptional regulator, partial [Planctomycetota bacterium]